jgi:hypothetical protein
MPRKRVKGRFAKENDEPDTTPDPRPVGAPRPANCRKFARARFAQQLPHIMDKLTKEALDGSVPHLKVLLELTGLDKAEPPHTSQRKEKSLEAILLEQWRKDEEDETAQAANAHEIGSNGLPPEEWDAPPEDF